MKTIRALTFITLIGALAGSVHAQIVSQFGSTRVASDYAYGDPGVVAAALQIAPNGGNTVTGSSTITLTTGTVSASNIPSFNPLSTTTPITVGIGTAAETVTPTAVSGCGAGQPQNACQVTASFANIHGTGDPVISGSYGLQEALNAAHNSGGGWVAIGTFWSGLGGTNATITSATSWSNVYIQDDRAGYTIGSTYTGAQKYWGMQPTTLTSLAVPTTLTSSTAVYAATPVGTWANSAYYLCVTYVDALGGEGPCSATYNATPTANYSLTVTSPVASTGAVGWRMYAGASYNAAYLLPVASTVCTLTTLETVFPACAIGSNGVFLAPPLTTTTLRPNGQTPTVNLNLPMPQGHTTFAYAPLASFPQPFQTNFGPFPAFGALTAGQVAVLGSVSLPTGYLNVIGRTIRVSGKVALTTLNTATLPYITIGLGWVGGLTAGAPISVCALVPAAAGSTATANETFNCTITTNAVGSTAVGTAMTNGYELLVAAAGGALTGATVDTGTAAIGSLGLFAQNTLYVTYTSTTNATAGEQLLDFHIETLQ